MQFDFGQNWVQFSQHALSDEKINQATYHFKSLLSGIPLENKSFLDIGFGQGISALLASKHGAKVTAIDINPLCRDAMEKTRSRFFPQLENLPQVRMASILDESVCARLGSYDVVHSWGVLHHTGNLKTALSHAVRLTRPGGYFVCALYNRHWTSPIWKVIKWIYCKSPEWLKRIWIGIFYPLIWVAKFLVTARGPKQMSRGMDFKYNVIDWIGGYPYEYASREEVEKWLKALGLSIIRFIPAEVPTGCNEFVFYKPSNSF